MSDTKDPLAAFGGCALLLASTAILTPVHWAVGGYTLATLWAWFVVPVFALPALSVGTAAGLMAVVGFVKVRSPDKKDDDDTLTTVGKLFGASVWYALYAALTLGMAWVLKAVWL